MSESIKALEKRLKAARELYSYMAISSRYSAKECVAANEVYCSLKEELDEMKEEQREV